MQTFHLKTHAQAEFVDITREVRRAIASAAIRDGLCLVACPHTTAGVTINENADPDVRADLLDILDRIVPLHGGYRHAEGNAAAHAKASLVGASVSLIVRGGQPVLGTWQSVFFCEFDGPRERTFHVAVIGG
jgi:secondary thiamine-phosphate synthase enzyme